MQKKIILISILIIMLTGCVKIDYSNKKYSDLVVNCLNKKSITNNVALGYKYYIPKGVKITKNYDYNQVFLVDNNYMYMYVDINSFYYNTKSENKDASNYYYFEKISYDGKIGYIAIKKETNKYYVEIEYNYSKIEFYSEEKKLNKMITLSSIILNSIDYNKKIIEKVLNESIGSFSEISYEIEKPEDTSSNFSQYLNEYIKEEEESEELPDE